MLSICSSRPHSIPITVSGRVQVTEQNVEAPEAEIENKRLLCAVWSGTPAFCSGLDVSVEKLNPPDPEGSVGWTNCSSGPQNMGTQDRIVLSQLLLFFQRTQKALTRKVQQNCTAFIYCGLLSKSMINSHRRPTSDECVLAVWVLRISENQGRTQTSRFVCLTVDFRVEFQTLLPNTVWSSPLLLYGEEENWECWIPLLLFRIWTWLSFSRVEPWVEHQQWHVFINIHLHVITWSAERCANRICSSLSFHLASLLSTTGQYEGL